ncbi:MAG: ATP-dependent zinc metalloprotease FtsH [Bacilli bacterium]
MPNLNRNNNSNSRSNRPFKTSYLYLIAIILIAIFAYVFVSNYNSQTINNYTDADIASPDGELYTILYEEDVKELSVENHIEGGYYYLTGSYAKDGNEVELQYFTATINSDNETAIDYFIYIVNTRSVTDAEGNIYPYYGEANGIYTFVDYSTETSFADYLPTIIIWAIVIIAGFYLFNRLSKSIGASGGAANSQFTFNRSRAKKQTQSKVRFKDVAGCDEVKAELTEMVDYFRNSKKYTRLGAKLPHGVLLVGPPGTGKTLLAKAVAGEAKVPFYSISGSDFVEMYVGVGAGRVRDMFKVAKQNAPCLIFIDEIDAVGRQRGAGMGGGNDEREQTLNQLLVEMDGFEDNNGIIVMAATNRADVLDPALTRAGRFDRQITVDLPDKEGREAVLKVHSRNKTMAPDVDFKAIASRTVGFSGADLENILNDAAILAVRANRDAINMNDIDEAIDRQIAGPAKTNRGISPEEKKRIAFHESGHAVLGIRLEHSEKVQRITIIPRGRTGGHVLMTPENDRFVLTKSELIARIVGLLGGRTSEELFIGDISTGASNDIEQATQIARLMVTEYGMSELGPIQYEKNTGSVFLGRDYNSNRTNYSTQVAFEIDKVVRQIIDEAHKKAVDVLSKYKEDVELIANTLIDKETITAEQIKYLIENRKLPPEKEKEEPKVEPDSESEPASKAESTVEKVPELTPQQIELEKGLKAIKKKIGNTDNEIIFIVAEDESGMKLTARGALKSIQQAYAKHIAEEIANGEDPKIVNKPCVSLTYSKEEITKMSDSLEEFAKIVEDETRTLVIVIKVATDDFGKFKTNFDKATGNSIVKVTPPSKKAKKAQKELKDLVNKENDEDNKK